MLTVTRIWLAIALLLAPLTDSLGQSQRNPQGKAQSTQQPAATDQRGTEQSPVMVKVLPTPKTEAETAADREERQQKAATDLWLIRLTGALALVGVMQLIVFGLQARRLRQTVEVATEQSRDMKQSIAEATRSAAAMERVADNIAISAKAAQESVATLKERTAAQMRAYLSVVVGGGVYQERDKGYKFTAQPLLVNTGHTPAHKVGFKSKAAILPIPLPDDFDFPLPAEFIGAGVLGPQQTFILGAGVGDFVGDTEVEDIKIGKGKALYVWGIVAYEDVFKETRETKYCQTLTWLPDGKIWCTYNPRHSDAT